MPAEAVEEAIKAQTVAKLRIKAFIVLSPIKV
jgi:hypothetical protein